MRRGGEGIGSLALLWGMVLAALSGAANAQGPAKQRFVIETANESGFLVRSTVTGDIWSDGDALVFSVNELELRAATDAEVCGYAMAVSGKAGNSWMPLFKTPLQGTYVRVLGGTPTVVRNLLFFIPKAPLKARSDEVYPTFVTRGVIDGQCLGEMYAHGQSGSLKALILSSQ